MKKVTDAIRNSNIQKILLDFSDADTLPNIILQSNNDMFNSDAMEETFIKPEKTYFKKTHSKTEKHSIFTMATSLEFDNSGTYTIDVNQLCEENDCTGIMNLAFLFPKKCKINYASIVVKNKCVDKITPALNSVIDHIEGCANENVLRYIPKFFCRDGTILLKESKVVINIDYFDIPMTVKFITDCVKISSYDINLNGDFINKIGNRLHYLCYGNNYKTYYVSSDALHHRHFIDLDFSGKLAYIFILLEPYNKECSAEFIGTLFDGNLPVCFFNELINKVNYCKLGIKQYNKNIYINTFSTNDTAIDSNKKVSNSYKIIHNGKMSLSFVLNNINNVACGSMFVHMWAPQFCEIQNLM